MVSLEIIKSAKAFLCWDCYHDLSIQLIPVRESAAYYYPPAEMGSIVLFYNSSTENHLGSLCLLFHEAGHHIQYKQWLKKNESESYWKCIQTPNGSEKIKLEQESWNLGRDLFQRFLEKEKLDTNLLNKYDSLSMDHTQTYS